MTHIRTLMDHMIQIDEGRMKDIFTADQEGKSAKEIAKALKLPLETVRKILGEDNDLQEFSDSQLDVLARQYAGLKGKTISVDNANKLRQIFKRIPDSAMDALRKKKIPFLSGLALSRMVQKGMPVKEDTETPKETPKENNVDKIALAKEKDTDALEKQLVVAQGQINLLKQKIENEKNKAVKPQPNKETGEVPLTIGVAYKHIKDKEAKEKEDKKEEVKEDLNSKDKPTVKDVIGQLKGAVKAHSNQVKDLEKAVKEEKNCGCGQDPCITYGKKDLDEELLDEMAALRKKADKSGISFSILKKVFDRGMAAWKGGHRPGASQHQWAYARVNSFITKGSGTWGGADKDLAKQARGQKEDLDAVPQDRDVKKKDGTQPKKYYKGLSKDVKDARASHFKNNDSNKEAPGDKDAKTKPSIHTQKYKKMYGEGARELVLKFLKQKMQTSKEEK